MSNPNQNPQQGQGDQKQGQQNQQPGQQNPGQQGGGQKPGQQQQDNRPGQGSPQQGGQPDGLPFSKDSVGFFLSARAFSCIACSNFMRWDDDLAPPFRCCLAPANKEKSVVGVLLARFVAGWGS